jgi:hypothetical protein
MGRSLKAWPIKRIKYPKRTLGALKTIRKKKKKNMKEKRTIR